RAALVIHAVTARIRRARDAMARIRLPRHRETDPAVDVDGFEQRRSDGKRERIRERAAVRAGVGRRAVDHVEAAADVDARRAFAQMKVAYLGIDEERVAERRGRAAAVALAARRGLVPEIAVRADVLERIGERLERRDRGAVLGEDVARDLRGSVAAAHADTVAI